MTRELFSAIGYAIFVIVGIFIMRVGLQSRKDDPYELEILPGVLVALGFIFATVSALFGWNAMSETFPHDPNEQVYK